MRVRFDVLEFPAMSVATTAMEFVPCDSVMPQVKLMALRVAGAPLHVIVDTPERLSITVPEMIWEVAETFPFD